MFCPFCGNTIEDNSTKCAFCNKKLDGIIAKPTAVTGTPEKESGFIPIQPPPPPKKNYVPIIIVASILATGIIVAALIFAFGNNTKTAEPINNTNTIPSNQRYTVVIPENLQTEPITQEVTKPLEHLSSITSEGDYYKVTMDGYLNMRTGPGLEYEEVVRIPEGDLVRLMFYNDNGKWAFVEYGPYTGWVSSPYIKYEGTYIEEEEKELQKTEPQTTEPEVQYNSKGIVELNTDYDQWLYETQRVIMDGYLNIRSGPGLEYDIVGSLDYLCTVDIQYYDDEDNWAKVQIGETEAWIDSDYLETFSENDVAAYYTVTASDGVSVNTSFDSFDAIAEIPAGETVGVVCIDPCHGMARVEYDGCFGWVDYSGIEFDKLA